MAIANGRSYLKSLIEDTVQVFESMLSDIPNYLKDGESTLELEIEKKVNTGADGDKEIEHSIRNSLDYCLLDYDNLFNCFYESYVISTYSFYEKALKIIVQECNLTLKKNKKKSFAIIYIDTIMEYLRISQFNSETEQMIQFINGEFRDLRNHLVHEGGITNISTFLHFVKSDYLKYNEKLDEGEYILLTLGKMKSVLLEIVQKIESYRRQEN